MNQITTFLQGKKTHLVVLALVIVTTLLETNGLSDTDMETLLKTMKQDLFILLVSTLRAALATQTPTGDAVTPVANVSTNTTPVQEK